MGRTNTRRRERGGERLWRRRRKSTQTPFRVQFPHLLKAESLQAILPSQNDEQYLITDMKAIIPPFTWQLQG